MFTIEIAGIPIAIDNRFDMKETPYDYDAFLTDKKPLLTISVSDDDLRQEEGFPCAYFEQICVFRKIALALPAFDAFLMHSAVIDIDGQGLAFSAKSGTGKTTRVLLWEKAMGDRMKVINGDKPILRFMDGTLYAFGTPWRGKEKMGTNTCVPLKYVCFIERSDAVSLRLLNTEEIVPRLFHQILLPKDAAQIEIFTSLMERFIKSVSFFLLKCNMEKEYPEAIWEEMKMYAKSKK